MIFGIPLIVVLAVTVYMGATVITTEYLKKMLFFIDLNNNNHSLMLSWIVGAFYFLLLYVFNILDLTVISLIFFAFANGILNLIYKYTILKTIIRKVLGVKNQ